MRRIVGFTTRLIAIIALGTSPIRAQETPQPPEGHQHATHQDPVPPSGTMLGGWHVMQDANVFVTFNRQGGPRGDTELNTSNWWMGMFSRPAGQGQLTIATMLSLDPLTVGKDGYSEIFQAGETYNGAPLIDRQHPHDLLMQLAAIWRVPLDGPARPDARRGTRGRTGARPRGLHAPAVGRGESHRPARASHVRLNAHRHGRDHGGPRFRTLDGRDLRLSRR